MEIRLARESDVDAMLAIYAPYVERTAISFEEEVPTMSAFAERVAGIQKVYPWLVAWDGAVIGYAYASQHRARASYRWCVDVAVYVDGRAHRRGAGRALYSDLLDRLRASNYVNAYAGITLPNDASVRLHESFGFTQIGVYSRTGFKMGRWHDVGWWQLRLREDDQPAEPLTSRASSSAGTA